MRDLFVCHGDTKCEWRVVAVSCTSSSFDFASYRTLIAVVEIDNLAISRKDYSWRNQHYEKTVAQWIASSVPFP
jgi:hypothetical protein